MNVHPARYAHGKNLTVESAKCYNEYTGGMEGVGGKDIAERRLERHNDVFADIMNVLLFGGRIVVKAEDLKDMKARTEYAGEGILRTQERDTAKEWNNGEVHIASVGIENQTAIDKAMPLRIMGYDGAAYRMQADSKMPFHPVITIVLHFDGEHRWNAPKSLLECMEVSSDIAPYVSDYKINVFDVAYLDDSTVQSFNSDFRAVAEFLSATRRHEEFCGTEQVLRHPIDTVGLLEELSESHGLIDEMMTKNMEKQGGRKMFDSIGMYGDRRYNEGVLFGREQGREQGRVQGRVQGLEQANIAVARAMLSRKLDVKLVSDCTGLPIEKVQSLLEQCNEAK